MSLIIEHWETIPVKVDSVILTEGNIEEVAAWLGASMVQITKGLKSGDIKVLFILERINYNSPDSVAAYVGSSLNRIESGDIYITGDKDGFQELVRRDPYISRVAIDANGKVQAPTTGE